MSSSPGPGGPGLGATSSVSASTSGSSNDVAHRTQHERHTYAKLEALKEIRSKTIGLERLRLRLLHELESLESEDKCLSEYRREMELLQQEKMAHVEELRQIHADINAMETVIKQAEESRRQSHDTSRRILEDYAPLKHDVDLMRTELLGLEKLPEISPEEKNRLNSAGLLDKPKPHLSITDPRHPWHHPGAVDGDVKGFFGLGRHGPHPPNPFLAAAAAQHSAMGLGPLGPLGAAKAEQLRTSLSAQAPGSTPVAPFRQQPPPMKSCLSCHQQIHRNAPICPLCKAKSRSRNPKKPKKKD